MVKFDYKKFQIGQGVRVKAVVDSHWETSTKYLERSKKVIERMECSETTIGQITGVRRIVLGSIIEGSSGYMGEDYEPNSFNPEKVIMVWEVRTGLTNKPILAYPEDLERVWLRMDMPVPILRSCAIVYSDVYRKAMSEDSKNWPRDAKGRWKGV
jgi:hypothetical protein